MPKMYMSRILIFSIVWFEGLKVSESNQEDPKTIEKLERKIDDIQCITRTIIVLIILIIITQISLILENPPSGSSGLWVFVTVVFLILAAISIFCTSSQRSLRTS